LTISVRAGANDYERIKAAVLEAQKELKKVSDDVDFTEGPLG